ncbi:MAG: 1-acyl-sn-glycerol-3-phosphate acyltransferase [Paraprevotella sp.]|nr:1-acyl-sn-glycerol-3-phosphate acyltransferase [Paraprevotella sp.]
MQATVISEIDVERIVRERAGAKARYVPQFLINALKRLIHQDFINEYLRQGYEGVDFCENCLKYLDVEVDVHGLENLPTDGRLCTFVSNHPLGAIDGVTLGMVLGRRYGGRVKFLVNDLLMNLKGLAPLCIPINKMGKQARNFPQVVEAGFRSDNHIIMFPAGLCSRRIDGEIQDLPWKKTFVTKSVETRRDVVPIHFEGQNSERFYSVANWCKRLHLKFNLAMLLLPDEMYHSRHKRYRVVIGQPIPWETFGKERTAAGWAQYVREQIYKL